VHDLNIEDFVHCRLELDVADSLPGVEVDDPHSAFPLLQFIRNGYPAKDARFTDSR
jgi:hypothetical protein